MIHERAAGGESDHDDILVARLRRSEEDAFELLVDRYAPRIRRWISAHVYDPAEVEDLTQEVLLSAWRAAPKLRSDTVLPAWLKTIAVNACRKRARRCLRKPAVPAGLAPPGTPSHDPPDVAESLDVAFALRQLPEREERVLRLLYRDELSIRQTAAILDVSADAAKSLAARARRRFRSRYITWFGQAAGGAVVLPLREVRELWNGLGGWFRSAVAAGAAAATAASLAVTVGPPQPTPPPTPPAQAAASAPAEEEPTAPSLAEPAQAREAAPSDDPAPADAVEAPDAAADAGSEAPTAEPGAEDPATTSASRSDDPGPHVGAVAAGEEHCRTDGDQDGDPDRDEEGERCEDGVPTPPPHSPGPAPGPSPDDPARVNTPLGPPTP